MANVFVNTSVTTTQNINDGEIGLVTAAGAVQVVGATGIAMLGNSSLTVLGAVQSTVYAVSHLDITSNISVQTGRDAVLVSTRAEALSLLGDGQVHLFNQGTLMGAASASLLTDSPVGAYLRASNSGGQVDVTNTGTMTGDFAGLYLDATSASFANNSGILSGFHGLFVGDRQSSGSDHRAQIIENSGTITATFGYAYHGGNWTDRLTNTGHIDGMVVLNDGTDLYDGRGGTVSEFVEGGQGNDVLLGGDGAEVMYGGGNEDQLSGHGGDDTLDGSIGNDILFGGAGNDSVIGDTGNDTLNGGAGDDTLSGGAGNDVLRAHGGEANRLTGGGGFDTLESGRGDDTMVGQSGTDVFVFGPRAGRDLISDFENGTDRIDLSAFAINAFSDVTAALSAAGLLAVRIDLAAIGGEGSLLVRGLTVAGTDSTDFIL